MPITYKILMEILCGYAGLQKFNKKSRIKLNLVEVRILLALSDAGLPVNRYELLIYFRTLNATSNYTVLDKKLEYLFDHGMVKTGVRLRRKTFFITTKGEETLNSIESLARKHRIDIQLAKAKRKMLTKQGQKK